MFEFVITRELAKQFAYDCFDEIIKDIKESKQLKTAKRKRRAKKMKKNMLLSNLNARKEKR